ncbi:hypothetical protein T11_14406 [Trichinella zimbabwensis]|uniref:Uncharacterized protein n=1 Tax=Trichinella zimbabwensis TaxID=268475 RepID=A0A0V1GT76_9BILA|nr:hypothetical protein T11_14406 [Trichinella zimbabwensis]
MCSLAWSEQPRCQKYFNLTLFQQLTTGVVSGIWDDADRYGQIDRLIAIPLFTGEKNKGGSWCCVTVVFVPGVTVAELFETECILHFLARITEEPHSIR